MKAGKSGELQGNVEQAPSASSRGDSALEMETSRFGSSSPPTEGGVVHHIDPRAIRPSQWANRHPRSFTTNDYELLKSSIEQAGINVQAIKIRPIPGRDQHSNSSRQEQVAEFEIVFGHRRHRACLELGLPVAAVVVRISDKDLFTEMDRENRAHKLLSPYEQGAMYRQALDSGLYPSANALAQELGVDPSLVSKSLSIVQLPKEVIEAFPSPLDIQYRWAAPLNYAYRHDAKALVTRADSLRRQAASLNAHKVFQLLINPGPSPQEHSVHISGRLDHAIMEVNRKGLLTVRFVRPMAPEQQAQIEASLRQILNRQ
ncbi:ParB/RepB/Spo0J family partition protein [Variovorax sp. J22R133]|uniref:ParB/RepB/Spo0J family partition protein n=1 Tax=Variovorax brevis TaxID=3053503 RepID=UPI00257782D7|nr:ParB/RepB/Spo0J family partition protein [Variovorax sp. J22R133]MDM0116212.1 ParB/RepB/Spo0J family partition protein [Variovorax sp. J22R133]